MKSIKRLKLSNLKEKNVSGDLKENISVFLSKCTWCSSKEDNPFVPEALQET